MLTLRGGTFNLLYGRDPDVVAKEVRRLFDKHKLDFLNVQEAADYTQALKNLPGTTYITGSGHASNRQCGILVASEHTIDRVRVINPGDGWWTTRGKKHRGNAQVQCRINKRVVIRSFHLPTPSHWRNGKIVNTPSERKDDLIAHMKKLRRFLRWPCKKVARLAAGDANEPPTTKGEYSPTWLRNRTGSKIAAPRSRAGHGRIDWVIYKGLRLVNIYKDLDIRERSDHEPVIFVFRGR